MGPGRAVRWDARLPSAPHRLDPDTLRVRACSPRDQDRLARAQALDRLRRDDRLLDEAAGAAAGLIRVAEPSVCAADLVGVLVRFLGSGERGQLVSRLRKGLG